MITWHIKTSRFGLCCYDEISGQFIGGYIALHSFVCNYNFKLGRERKGEFIINEKGSS